VKTYIRSWLPFSSYNNKLVASSTQSSAVSMPLEFECAACGASGPTAIFEDIVSGDSLCVYCGTVHDTAIGFLDSAEQTLSSNHQLSAVTNAGTFKPVVDTSGQLMSDVDREIEAACNPVLNRHVSIDDKKKFGCAYRMFDTPFDIMAKRCDLMEGLANRRALIAMRAACERVGVLCPEFTLTHDPGVQATAAYVVATHPPGVDRGRTRLLKEGDEQCGLRGICSELGVTMSAVAKCVRNHGDRLYTAMKDARRIGVLPELDPGGHLTAESNRRLRARAEGRRRPTAGPLSSQSATGLRNNRRSRKARPY
jgi:hypothetical protein